MGQKTQDSGHNRLAEVGWDMIVQNIKVLRRNLKQALSKGQCDQAALILERLQQEDPLALETRGLQFEYLLCAERLLEANKLSGQLVKLFPGSGRIRYLAGRLHYRQKNYPTAEHHFRESELIYSHASTRRWLGKTLTQLGRFEEAESILQGLLPSQTPCRLDLAWLYERMQENSQALQQLEAYLEKRPQDQFALGQRLRLRARLLPAEELLDEVDTLLLLGEQVPAQLLPGYLENLLRMGQGSRAREFINTGLSELDLALATQLAWVCYRMQAYDLALQLFSHALPANLNNIKFLTTLETVAGRCDRLESLIELYETHAEQEKKLYGRAKKLARRLGEKTRP